LASAIFARPAVATTIEFVGMTWNVKQGGPAGPGPNYWSDSSQSVWVDGQGQLHLQIRKIGNTWYSAEVSTQASLGHGAYLFQIASDVDTFDRNVIVGLFTYLNDNNEIDIEFARWGSAAGTAGQYVTQPAGPGNIEHFDISAAGVASTHDFTWGPESIVFRSYQGFHDQLPASPGERIHDWTYTGADVPPESSEKLHLNLWLLQGQAPSDGQAVELVIRDLIFVPDAEPCSTAVPSFAEADAFFACENGPGGVIDPNCACADRNGDQSVDVVDFALLQAAFVAPGPGAVLFDFESGSQGWFSFGGGTVSSGLLPSGGSGGAGPQGRFHLADFSDAAMTWGMGDVSAAGQDMSAYTAMSIDARLRSPVPQDPFVGTPQMEFMLASGESEWAAPFLLTDSYQTFTANFANLAPQGTATQPITPAQLSDPALQIKLVMRKNANAGQASLDYDQIMGIP
jgi:hypothetical protein